MIRPISSVDGSCPAFRGIIKSTPILNNALRHFNQSEKDEFARLRQKALDVDDGKVYGLYLGNKSLAFDRTGRKNQSEIKYIGLYEEGKPRKEVSEEIYSLRMGDEILENKKAYAKAILEPLKKMYDN